MDNCDLVDLEKKAYVSTLEDGLWEFGFGLLMIHLGLILSNTGYMKIWFATPTYLLAVLGPYFAKKYISEPRIGKMRVSPQRQKKLDNMGYGGVLVTMGFILFGWLWFTHAGTITLFASTFSNPAFILLDGLLIFAGLSILTYVHDFDRGIIYAILWSVSVMHMLVTGTAIALYASGISMLIISLYVFLRFLKKYPLDNSTLLEAHNGTD